MNTIKSRWPICVIFKPTQRAKRRVNPNIIRGAGAKYTMRRKIIRVLNKKIIG